MQSVSSRIWTRVAVFHSYDDNNYTTGTSSLQFVDDAFTQPLRYDKNVTQGEFLTGV